MKDNKIEQFLTSLKYGYREAQPDLWLLDGSGNGLEGTAIVLAGPDVIIRVQVMDAPRQKREDFFAELLRLNATDMIRGAYGLEGDTVVITDTLEYAPMDFSEFKGSLDAISLSLAQHYPALSAYREK